MHQALVERALCLREHTSDGTQLIFAIYYRRKRKKLTGHPAVQVGYPSCWSFKPEGDARWMEIRDHLKQITNYRKAGPAIVFEGERFDVRSVRRWREEALGLTVVRSKGNPTSP